MSSHGSDYILPEGWKKKESHSHPGRYYYISPDGATQWFKPESASSSSSSLTSGALSPTNTSSYASSISISVRDPPEVLNPIHIEFGPGRLGVKLRVSDDEDLPNYPVEVESLPKLVNGQAGPAEIYNWSVKGQGAQLRPGMRICAISGQSVSGWTYAQVIETIRTAERPMILSFGGGAASWSTVEETTEKRQNNLPPSTPNMDPHGDSLVNERSNSDPDEPTRRRENSSSPNASQQRRGRRKSSGSSALSLALSKCSKEELEHNHKSLLITAELHEEVWNVKTTKLENGKSSLRHKLVMLTDEYELLKQHYDRLKLEYKNTQKEKEKLSSQKQELSNQAKTGSTSAEARKSKSLAKKNQSLLNEVAQLREGIGELKRERGKLQKSLDEVYSDPSASSSSSKSANTSMFQNLVFENSSQRQQFLHTDPANQLDLLKEQYQDVSMDVGKAHARVDELSKTLEQLRPQNDNTLSSSSSVNRRHRGHSPASPSIESDIQLLRQALHDTVSQMAKLRSKSLNEAETRTLSELTTHREQLKLQLKNKQDEQRGLSSSSLKEHSGQKPPPLPTHQGLLHKSPSQILSRGITTLISNMRGSKPRWFELDEMGVLSYYKRQGDKQVRGKLDVKDQIFELVVEDPQDASVVNTFWITSGAKQIRVESRTREDWKQWIKCLQKSRQMIEQYGLIKSPLRRDSVMSSNSSNPSMRKESTTELDI